MKRQFIIENQPLGSTTIPDSQLAELSLLWYCGSCGEVYARLPLDPPGNWLSIAGCCSACQPTNNLWWQIPGSIWCSWNRKWNEQMSPEVLRREFWLAINYYGEVGK